MNTAFADFAFHRAEPGFGLPEDRLARLAARRAFVEMKGCFLRAVADLDGATGSSLQHKVRQAGEVIELWRLRHAVLGALPTAGIEADQHRRDLLQQLDSVFPDASGSAFVPL